MYKTIRHGENSLQYTILPQNDDFRIESKLTSAESNCSSNKRKTKGAAGAAASNAKRPKRRSFFAYLGLIFVCTVIVGAVLIPFLVSAECLPSPSEWFIKTKAALTKSGSETDKAELHTSHNAASASNTNSVIGTNGVNIGKTVKIINKDGIEKFLLKINKTAIEPPTNKSSTFFNEPNGDNIGNNDELKSTATNAAPILNSNAVNIDNDNDASGVGDDSKNTKSKNESSTEKRYDISNNGFVKNEVLTDIASVIPSPTSMFATLVKSKYPLNQINNNNLYDNNILIPPTKQTIAVALRPTYNVNAPRTLKNPNQNNNNNDVTNNAPVVAMPTITTRIIQVPLLKSAAKKPIVPPVLAKTNSEPSSPGFTLGRVPALTPSLETTRNSTEHLTLQQDHANKNNDWINKVLAYINPSTHLKWNSYKAEDSVLLPALLGFALIGIILFITVCLVARNKRTIVSSVRKRNRNDIEENGAEDNATLLTTTNLSDED